MSSFGNPSVTLGTCRGKDVPSRENRGIKKTKRMKESS